MRKDLIAIGLGAVLSSATVFSSLAAGVILPGHVPVAISHLQTAQSSPVDSEKMMQISIGLPVRNQAALSNLIQQVSDPASPNFRHYLTPAQFADAFGPTETDYQAVINFAQQHNLTVTQKHPNRLVLSVQGKAADVEKAFQITLRNYPHPKENRTFFEPDTDPVVDAGLKIIHISGLDNYSIPHPNIIQRDPAQVSQIGPKIGSGPAGSYQGNDFRRAYAPNTTLTGAGQSVGLVQFDGFFASDIAAYESQIGLTGTPPNLVVIPIDGGVPVPGSGNVEVSLDIEMILSMAPKVSNIYVYEAPNPSPWVDILSRMANDNSAKQLSCSWGGGGPDPIAEQIFQQMAVQGQSFFAASGDSDAYTGPIPFPSDSPHITVVGGTTLTTAGRANYASETVWNWGISIGPTRDGQGSCGGVSTFYGIPSWQTNINMVARGGSSTFRNVPDVALTADNVLVFFGGGQAQVEGGTSCAAPLWAGFMALANQQAALNGQASLGFINPTIYSIARSANYSSSFHDITTGNNAWSGSPNAFSAVSGYDLATGLGTPNGTNFINALLGSAQPIVHISPPPPPYGTNMAVVNGGNPNGQWMMFVQDDAPISSGMIANGWVLNLTTADVIGTAGDIEVLMNTTNVSAFAGQTETFVVTVTNYGPSLSTNVTVSDTLPLGTIIVSTNTTQGTVSRVGSTLTWNVGNLTLNNGAAMTVTVKAQSAGTLVNTATVNTGTPDPNPDDDLATASVSVVPLTATLTPSFTNGAFHISVPGPTNPSLTVIIQMNTNLVSSNWVNVYTGAPPIDFVDPAPSGSASRFYRAILLP